MDEGDTIRWADRQIHYVRLEQRELPDKLVAEAVLEVARDDSAPVELRPARHLHLLQNDWTTEVAIQSDWGGDFYVILHGSAAEGRASLTLVENPMMRWLWLGGTTMAFGATITLWPRSRTAYQTHSQPVTILGKWSETRRRKRRPGRSDNSDDTAAA